MGNNIKGTSTDLVAIGNLKFENIVFYIVFRVIDNQPYKVILGSLTRKKRKPKYKMKGSGNDRILKTPQMCLGLMELQEPWLIFDR
ncbi:hypothetical protein AYI69_g9241 [Smittium culicis]|uniref:Uncharacterized protein n=1 Tax=Smittium culicis TaxID=133412 RepID=A0A1R1XE07_9FUNG|nr:hypothetical protein AYI69_g9241 [Smittium culicis]